MAVKKAEFMAESAVLEGGMAERNRPWPMAEFPGGYGGAGGGLSATKS